MLVVSGCQCGVSCLGFGRGLRWLENPESADHPRLDLPSAVAKPTTLAAKKGSNKSPRVLASLPKPLSGRGRQTSGTGATLSWFVTGSGLFQISSGLRPFSGHFNGIQRFAQAGTRRTLTIANSILINQNATANQPSSKLRPAYCRTEIQPGNPTGISLFGNLLNYS